ncbi:MAG: tetratricopeptide repeat protein [Cyclobacteriaceae bacterium]
MTDNFVELDKSKQVNTRNLKMRILIPFLLLLIANQGTAQKLPLFDHPERMELVAKAGFYIYNNEYKKADSVIEKVEKILYGHPVVHMMRALNIAWQEMPIRTTSEVFPEHYDALQKVIESSQLLTDLDDKHREGIFFEMSARGLLTEYYAEEGTYLKALGEARKMYALVKTGFDFVDDSPEFLFSTGLYNYFREKYPERHPIYKPFMWFFKSGDLELGLKQLHEATETGSLTKIEAHLYLSYIYLRYENNPVKAQYYLDRLVREYPKNSYFKAKLIECLVFQNNFSQALPHIEELKKSSDPYYKMSGLVNLGIYQEKKKANTALAIGYYNDALRAGSHYLDKGLYYKSLCWLGLGRISQQRGNNDEAEEYFKKAIAANESDLVTDEAKKRLKKL